MPEKTVLVVEDNPSNMMLVCDLLELGGYRVVPAQTGGEGIRLAGRESPDLILMDIGLPDIDGLEAVRILKSETRTKNIPIVAVTAFAMKGDKEKAMDAGCSGYIVKPIVTREFLRTVAGFLAPDEA